MKKEHCNFCWAKLPDGSCFCVKEKRPENCRKARMRLAHEREENMQPAKELQGLRDYIAYIPMRLAYLNAQANGKNTSNEWKYYVELYKAIKEWGRTHEVFFKYLIKKINFSKVVKLLGRAKRQCIRIVGTTRKMLVDYIQKQETLLREKYPFEPCEGWGAEEESNERTS